MRPFALACAALLLACQPPPVKSDAKREATPTPTPASRSTPTPASTPDPACDVATLEADLLGYCDYDLGVPPLALPRVAWTAESYHPLATRVISLDAGGLDDPEGQGTHSVAAWLEAPPRRLPEPGELVFAIAADVPATTVAELFDGLARAGRKRVRVLVHVGDAQAVPQPYKPEMLTAMRGALPEDPKQRVVFVAQQMGVFGQVCPDLNNVFPSLRQVTNGERCARLAELASQALHACDCTKLPELMTLLYAMTMGFDPPPGRAAAVDIELTPVTTVLVEPSVTWGQVVARTLTDPSPRALMLAPA